MQKLTDHVYGILTLGAYMNAYLIDNAGALTVVDTGMSAAFAGTIEKEILSIGKSLDDVQQIFITHYHPDHVGGLAALRQKINVPTYAHRVDAAILRGEQPPAFPDPKTLPLLSRLMLRMIPVSIDVYRVDVLLNGDESLDNILPGAKVVHLPGHSPGQIGLWLEGEKTLICGDALMQYPWGLSRPVRAFSTDWNGVTESIRQIAAMDVQNLCMGHGKPLIGGADEQIREFVKRL